MNKKILMFGIPILLIGVVAALTYYAIFSTTFNVNSSIVSGDCGDELGEVYEGEMYEGSECTITNNAPSERTITFAEETECDIETSYTSTVDMNMKNSSWSIIPETTVVLSYVMVGEEFKYKVDTELEDYVVVYYPDTDGNPGSWNIENATLVGETDTEWTSSEVGFLPNEDDWNADAEPNGAKLWLIPEEDWDAQSWNPDDWYFENNLITYDEEVTIDAESSITVIPLYEIGDYESGECEVTTTVA